MTLDLAGLERLAAAATSGPWTVQDGCSWRRIGARGDGDVLCPIVARDGHPDLDGRNREADMAFIAAARAGVPALVARVRELEADRAWDRKAWLGFVRALLRRPADAVEMVQQIALTAGAGHDRPLEECVADAMRTCTAWGHPEGEVEGKGEGGSKR